MIASPAMIRTSEEYPAETNGHANDRSATDFLSGGGEMGALIRAKDWSKTPLGPPETWPQSLRTAVGLMLSSRYAMFVWWGRALTNLYNNAYCPFLGSKHPGALGQSARNVWAEIWDLIGPRTEVVLNGGESTFDEALLLVMERYGYPEETYFTFSYSPIRDDQGKVGGIFCAVTEATSSIISERRLKLLRDVAAKAPEAHTPEQVCAATLTCIAENARDLPFALLYLPDGEATCMRLVGSAGIEPNDPAAPQLIDLKKDDATWPFASVQATGAPLVLEDIASRFERLPKGPWDRPPMRAVIAPLSEQGHPGVAGFLVAGLNPYLPYEEGYSGFIGLLTGQIAASVASARAREQERKRAEALAEIDRAKTLFFSNVSHEFRTPLTLMLGPLEDALSSADLPPNQRERLDVAHRNSLRLLKLVNSLLDFSRIEAGRVEATYEPVDFAALTAELVSNFRSACERAGLNLVVDCSPLAEPIYADRDMWEKIVLNLLSNAFKFTFEGEITVRLRQMGEHAELTIHDTGVGIPEDELPRLFERFHRIEGQKSRTHEGSGIGLALVQELVKLHGATISVESKAGRGTTFMVRVPFGTAHLPQDRIRAERSLASTFVRADAYLQEALRWLPDAAPVIVRSSEIDGPGAAPVIPKGARILLADDNADMRAYIRRLLGGHCEVQTAPDGEAALAAIREHRPDLVLADVMMPRLDGFGLLRAIRNDPELRALPVIMLSARASEQSRVEGLEAGADDYLTKPFSARELIARVDANLELSRVRRQALTDISENEQRTRALFQQAPGFMCVLSGPAHVFEFVNESYMRLVGRRDLLGKPLRDVLPEVEAQGFVDLLDQVYRTGEPYKGIEVPIQLQRVTGPSLHQVFVNFIYQPIRDGSGKVTGILVEGFDATERKLTEEALRKSEEQLSAELETTRQLHAISTQLIHERDAKALYDKIIDAAVSIMRSDFASMQMLYPERGERGELHLLTFRGFDPQAAKFWEWVRADSGCTCGEALRTGRRAVASNVETCEFMAGTADRTAYLQAGMLAAQSTPLISRSGRVLGMLSTHWREPHDPTESDLQRFDVLARQAADLIERAAAETALAQQVADMQRLYDFSRRLLEQDDIKVVMHTVLVTVAELLNVEKASIQLYDESLQRLRLISTVGFDREFQERFQLVDVCGFTSCAAALNRRERVIIADLGADPEFAQFAQLAAHYGIRAAQSTPLLDRSGMVSAMLTTYFDRPYRPAERELRLMDLHLELAARQIERKQAEAVLRRSEERFRAFVAASSDVVYRVSPDWSEMRHLDGKEFIPDTLEPSRTWLDRYIHPDDQPRVTEAIDHAIRTKSTFELEHRVLRVDGTLGWTSSRAIPVMDAEGEIVEWFGAATDITESKHAEEALRESEGRMRDFLATLDLSTAMIHDPDGTIRFWSAGCERLYGWSAKEALGRSAHELLRTEFPVALSEIESVLEHEREWAGDLLHHRRNGKEIVVAARMALRRDAAGRPAAVVESVADVTGLRKAEAELRRLNDDLEVRVREEVAAREATQAKLAHAQRMEALGQLAGGIAHDFNNVLQGVLGGASLIERRSVSPESVRRIARMVFEAAERGASITSRLLAFSRRGDLRAEAVDAAALLAGMREILMHTLGAGIGVRVDAPPGLPELLADKGQLETVLINLATNARDAMAGNGLLTFSAAVEVLQDRDGPDHPVNLKPGPYIRLAVTDTGTGMPPEVLAHATEPFFTTKGHDKGTGLGLAMARGFAEQSGGGLHIESERGRGTTVKLWFPLATERAPVLAEPSFENIDPAGQGRARLLLVDDEPIVREVLTEQMEAAGYTVLPAANAPAALALLDAGETIDLLVSDLSMPGMDGLTLVREVQRRRPRLPAILLTGFATNAAEIAVGGAVSGSFTLLRKPIEGKGLAERVAVLLKENLDS